MYVMSIVAIPFLFGSLRKNKDDEKTKNRGLVSALKDYI